MILRHNLLVGLVDQMQHLWHLRQARLRVDGGEPCRLRCM